MKKLILAAFTAIVLFSCKTKTEDVKFDKAVKIHEGSFTFCGASGAIPTGKKIIVQGVEYDEGCAICPVLTGPSISNLAMEGISVPKIRLSHYKCHNISAHNLIHNLLHIVHPYDFRIHKSFLNLLHFYFFNTKHFWC